MLRSIGQRRRGRIVAVLLAVAAVLLASAHVGRPGGAVPRLTSDAAGEGAPGPQGRGDRPVQVRHVAAPGARARALPPRPRDAPAPGRQRPRRQAPGPRRGGARAQQAGPQRHAQRADAQHRRHRRPRKLATTYPKTVGADKLWAAGITGKGIGVAVIDSGISAGKPDFKGADGSSRVTANVIVSSAATGSGDERRPRHARRRHRRRQLAAPRRRRPVLRRLRRHRSRGRPDRAQGGRRRRRGDDGRRHHGAAVHGPPQGRARHRRREPLDELGHARPSYLDDPINAAVEYVWHSGIVVVVAAGNRGSAADAVQYPPGNDPYVISVGATDELGNG